MAAMGDIMSRQNDDGIGYAALDKAGNLFGERWLFNQEAFDNHKFTHTKGRKIDKTKINRSKMMLGSFVELEDETDIPSFEKYGTFGELSDEVSAVILHARRATNLVCFENTHPFVDEINNTAVIHNGVITNVEVSDNIRSTCDSERILNMYLKHKIAANPLNMQAMIDELKGWFACGILSKDKDNRWIMDIFRNSQANLGCAFVKELDAMVFATDINDVRAVCHALNLTIVSKSKSAVKDDMLLRIEAMTGKPLMTFKYKHNNWHYNNNQYSFKHEANTSDDAYKEMVAKWNKDKADEAAAEEAAAEERRNRWKNGNVIDFNKPESRPSENATQEQRELELAGVTTEEYRKTQINKLIDELNAAGWTGEPALILEVATREVDELILRKKLRQRAEETGAKQKWNEAGINKYEESLLRTNKLIPKLKETKDIITGNTYDPLNENKASGDNWYFNSTDVLWSKKRNGKH